MKNVKIISQKRAFVDVREYMHYINGLDEEGFIAEICAGEFSLNAGEFFYCSTLNTLRHCGFFEKMVSEKTRAYIEKYKLLLEE